MRFSKTVSYKQLQYKESPQLKWFWRMTNLFRITGGGTRVAALKMSLAAVGAFHQTDADGE